MTAPTASGGDRLIAIHGQLTAAVADLAHDLSWRRMLDVASRCHRYSPSNLLLIAAQRPDASVVAGYRAWQQLGRQVSTGEHGIAILAPLLTRPVEATEPTSEGELTPRALRGFRVAHVFDVSQTQGRELPQLRPPLLAGGSPRGLWARLAAQVSAAGYTLDRGSCGDANGRTDHRQRHVRVRDDVSPAQAAKTLAHELTHVVLHQPDGAQPSRPVCEVEAESVAYIVTAAAGLPTDAYSVPYVAGWAAGDVTLVQATATRVLVTARQVLHAMGALPDPFARLSADRAVSLTRPLPDSRVTSRRLIE